MLLLEIIKMSLNALRQHKGRAALTILGVMIGVGSIVTIVSMGKGASIQVRKELTKLGTNLLTIAPGSTTAEGIRLGTGTAFTLTVADAQAIYRECKGVYFVSYVTREVMTVSYKNKNWTTTVSGVTPEYSEIRDWPPSKGHFFTREDMNRGANVCLIGQKVMAHLYAKGENPLGTTLFIKGIPFRVIGVMSPKGYEAGGADRDDEVFMPFTTAESRVIGSVLPGYVSRIFVSTRTPEATFEVERQVKALLRQRHHLRPGLETDDFFIKNLTHELQVQQAANTVLNYLLAITASVSLIVGGIGIMNIMLVSIRERTREIGIRVAIGARRKDILFQFLIESVVLSSFGGVIGMIIGVIAAVLIAFFGHWPISVSPLVIFVAFLFSLLVGIVFGLYPANRASRLHPIEALRYE